MTRSPRATRTLAPAAVALGVLALAFASARDGRSQTQDPNQDPPKAADPAAGPAVQVPDASKSTLFQDGKGNPLELLAQPPHDKLTLIDNAVFLIEPISPRPLPAYTPKTDEGKAQVKGDTLKLSDQEAARKAAEAKKDENPDELIIHLLEGEQKDFKVKRSSIKSVEYWEDILLAESDRLIGARNFPKAFEYLLAVQARNPNWKGLVDHFDKLLFEEGSWALAGNDRPKALRLLEDLQRRRPEYPGLAPKLAEAFAGEIEKAVADGAYAYGRKVLHDLGELAPDSTVLADLRNRYLTRSRDLAKQAEAARGYERLDLLARSLRVWPDQQGTPERFAEAFRELPTLDVGVVDVPRPVAPWINSPASARVTPLLYLPLLVDETDDALLGKKAGQLVTGLELGDLGRRIEIQLRDDVRWSDDSRALSVIDVVRALSDRAQPRSPAYNARWADLLERIDATDVDRVTIRLTRSPLSPPRWLITPVGPAHAAWDGRVARDDGRIPVGDGPFAYRSEAVSKGAGEVELVAADRKGTGEQVVSVAEAPAEPDGPAVNLPLVPSFSSGSAQFRNAQAPRLPVPKIKRVREVHLADATAAMIALDRGEISLLEVVPHDRVEGLKANPEYHLGAYRQPSLHRLALDGRTPALKSRLLRRGITYAINRQTILEEVLLRRPIDEKNRPSDGPFAVESYANAPDVRPYDFNMLRAKMLVAGAKRELGTNRIRLTLEYPARFEAQISVGRIAEGLREAGLEIDLVERPESELEQALRAGRRFDLAYRVGRCDEPIYEVGALLCPGYDAPPQSQGLAALASPRILQLLLQLEHAPEYATARELVTQIDRECRDELPIIPLWQLQDHYAWRDRLKGPAETADHLYQGIETWEIEPWYARDPW
jgi:peptide/nickel transport system substrate-binding protein